MKSQASTSQSKPPLSVRFDDKTVSFAPLSLLSNCPRQYNDEDNEEEASSCDVSINNIIENESDDLQDMPVSLEVPAAAVAKATILSDGKETHARYIRVLSKTELLCRLDNFNSSASNVINVEDGGAKPSAGVFGKIRAVESLGTFSSSTSKAGSVVKFVKVPSVGNTSRNANNRRNSLILSQEEPSNTPTNYQPLISVPPQVDTRAGRGLRATDTGRVAAAVAAATAASAATGQSKAGKQQQQQEQLEIEQQQQQKQKKKRKQQVSITQRGAASSDKVRNKHSSVCGILFVFLLLILPVTMVVGTATQISTGCHIWLSSPILLLVIGLCSIVLAIMGPLLMFRLMGVSCLEDLVSVRTITFVNILMGVIIFIILLVLTGAMLFQPNKAIHNVNCTEFIKKFVIVCVAVLWFLVVAIALTFCCDAIMS